MQSIEHFLALVHTRTEFTELTPKIVHMSIKMVEVGEAVYTPPKHSHWTRGKTQMIWSYTTVWERYLLSEAGRQRETTKTGRFAELQIACTPDSDTVVAVIRAKGIECEIRGRVSKDIFSVVVETLSDHA